jgi:aryl-alcohol dehydrogenase-like predicted oxidoreductase
MMQEYSYPDISKIAVGTVQFGLNYGVANFEGKTSGAEAEKILRYARFRGSEVLDTAIHYGGAESLLGAIGVSDWKILSKLPSIGLKDYSCHSIEKAVYESVERLGVDHLYGLHLSKADDLLGPEGPLIFNQLCKLKNEKVIQKIGVSFYSSGELNKVLSIYDLDVCQIPVNIFDRRFLDNDLELLKSRNIEIHARSIFLQGLLLMSGEIRPAKFQQWNSIWARWDKFLKNHEITALQACLSFIYSIEAIDKIVIGFDSLNHLKQIEVCKITNIVGLINDLSCDDEFLLNPSLWGKN